MKLAVYRRGESNFLGVMTSSGLIDVTPWVLEASSISSNTAKSSHWCSYISLVMQELPLLQSYVAAHRHICIDLKTVELLPPVLHPGKLEIGGAWWREQVCPYVKIGGGDEDKK